MSVKRHRQQLTAQWPGWEELQAQQQWLQAWSDLTGRIGTADGWLAMLVLQPNTPTNQRLRHQVQALRAKQPKGLKPPYQAIVEAMADALTKRLAPWLAGQTVQATFNAERQPYQWELIVPLRQYLNWQNDNYTLQVRVEVRWPHHWPGYLDNGYWHLPVRWDCEQSWRTRSYHTRLMIVVNALYRTDEVYRSYQGRVYRQEQLVQVAKRRLAQQNWWQRTFHPITPLVVSQCPLADPHYVVDNEALLEAQTDPAVLAWLDEIGQSSGQRLNELLQQGLGWDGLVLDRPLIRW